MPEAQNITVEKIEAEVMGYLTEEYEKKPGELTRDTSFVKDLNTDSLDIVEMVVDLEEKFEEFGLRISDEEVAKIQTIGQLIDYISSVLMKK